MKINIFGLILSLAIITFTNSCTTTSPGANSWGDNGSWENITKFRSDYFPNQSYSMTDQNEDNCIIRVKGGPSVTFAPSGRWASVVGYGSTLPQMFLFDQLPPELYEYIQKIDALGDVYSVIINRGLYTVDLIDTSVVYDMSTGAISQPANIVKTASKILR